MPSEHEPNGSASYLPTSLDFINLPNPIQPAPQLQKHPLNRTPHLEKARLENAPKQDLFKLILDTERPSKRQKTVENPHLDLPLPARQNAKRHRLPPTLSGLHQPPPESGLLPSINTEQPEVPPPRLDTGNPSKIAEEPAQIQVQQAAPTTTTSSETQPVLKQISKNEKIRTKRTRWSDEETRDLLKGVEEYGIGAWTKILNDGTYKFNNRTALDLKDRFRVCCPDSYKRTRLPKGKTKDVEVHDKDLEAQELPTNTARAKTISLVTRDKYGISKPFAKSERRSRTGWSTAEDESLLRGVKKYGNEWAAIRDDPSLNLSHRQRIDLRGRLRTRYPEEYAKAVLLAKKSGSSSTGAGISEETPEDFANNDTNTPAEDNNTTTTTTTTNFPETNHHAKPNPATNPTKTVPEKRPPQPRLFSLDDIYLGPFGIDDDEDNERIVLDRGILDWATIENPRPATTIIPDNNRSHGINPQMTLKLPKPNAGSGSSSSSGGGGSGGSTVAANPNPITTTTTTTTLPSLATLVPPDIEDYVDNTDPLVGFSLGLPSLSQWYDEQARAGPMALEEILS